MFNRRVLLLSMALTVSGCSGGDPAATKSTVPDTTRDTPSAPAALRASNATELTAESLSAYERGLKREIEAVRAAQERSSAATNAQERGEAMQAAFEDATIPQGADAAGMPVEPYRALRNTVNGIFQTLDFQGTIDGPLSMDLSRADPATKERLSRDPFDALSPASAAALRAQMDRLVPVWIQYVSLTAVAG